MVILAWLINCMAWIKPTVKLLTVLWYFILMSVYQMKKWYRRIFARAGLPYCCAGIPGTIKILLGCIPKTNYIMDILLKATFFRQIALSEKQKI
jgi:hypothetical protein